MIYRPAPPGGFLKKRLTIEFGGPRILGMDWGCPVGNWLLRMRGGLLFLG